MYICMYAYIYMVDFGKSDKMIKISGKVYKSIMTTGSAMIFRFYQKTKKKQKQNFRMKMSFSKDFTNKHFHFEEVLF